MNQFDRSIAEVRKAKKSPFLVAHRGVMGANVPCNTMAAFKIAVEGGADVVELDVATTRDGAHFVFHPGMEPVFLGTRPISEMTAEEVLTLRLRNSDSAPTSYPVPTLREALDYLKGKVYINVDKFWTDVEGITREIREAGVAKQVIVKTFQDKESLDAVAKFAPDLMFMPLVRRNDNVTDDLIARGVNVIGAEILFETEEDEVISPAYIKAMHDRGLLIWMNAIIYNEKDVISAHRTDDRSLVEGPEAGWGWMEEHGADFIQTDWLYPIKAYFEKR